MKIAELYPIAQFRMALSRFVIVTDKNLVREILSEIHGKGFPHRGPKNFIPRTTFNLDTGDEWNSRRTLFRRPFSSSSLSKFTTTIKTLAQKLCAKLSQSADVGNTVPID